MTKILFVLLGLAMTGIAISLQKMRKAILSAGDQTLREWQQLKKSLLDRHLVITHLLDSLPNNSVSNFDRNMLSEANTIAEASVRKIEPSSADADDFARIAADQNDCAERLSYLTAGILLKPELMKIRSIKGCLKGLTECEQKIDEAASIYNTAVIAFQTRMESRRAKFVSLFRIKTPTFCELHCGCTGNSSSVRMSL